MINHPSIELGERIEVGLHDCIVQELFPTNSKGNICWAIYIQKDITLKAPVGWNGKEWYVTDFDAITKVNKSEPFYRDIQKLGESIRISFTQRE